MSWIGAREGCFVGAMTFRIPTFSVMDLFVILTIKDTQYNDIRHIQSVIMLSFLFVKLNVIMLSVIMLSVVMLSVGMLSVVMLSVGMLSVFMLNVVAPLWWPLPMNLWVKTNENFLRWYWPRIGCLVRQTACPSSGWNSTFWLVLIKILQRADLKRQKNKQLQKKIK
jgi:hypothetical protein